MRLRILLLALPLVAVDACALTDTVTEVAEDIVVAEVYLRTDARAQTAWLHRTRAAAGGGSQRVDGAQIEVTRESTTQTLTYVAAPDSMCVVRGGSANDVLLGSCYAAQSNSRFSVVPGERYNLQITLPDGDELTGTTVVPGDFRMLRPTSPACTLPAGTRLDLTWTTSAETWAYIAETHIHGLRRALATQGIEIDEDPLRLVGLSITRADTTIAFPAEFGLFDRFNPDLTLALAAIQQGLPDDTHADVVVAAADRNYTNWERGGNFNPSGLVRIASIRGDGTGAFGSLVIRAFAIYIAEANLPPC